MARPSLQTKEAWELNARLPCSTQAPAPDEKWGRCKEAWARARRKLDGGWKQAREPRRASEDTWNCAHTAGMVTRFLVVIFGGETPS